MKDIEKSKFLEVSLSTHGQKMAELRKLFRLEEFSKNFTQEDFEQARNKARETQGFPAENIQKRKAPFDLFVQDVIKQGQWTTRAEVGQLWKQLSSEKRSEYEERSKSVKQQIVEFEQDKLPQLLNDPQKFYWLLRVNSYYSRSMSNYSGFGGKEVPYQRRTRQISSNVPKQAGGTRARVVF